MTAAMSAGLEQLSRKRANRVFHHSGLSDEEMRRERSSSSPGATRSEPAGSMLSASLSNFCALRGREEDGLSGSSARAGSRRDRRASFFHVVGFKSSTEKTKGVIEPITGADRRVLVAGRAVARRRGVSGLADDDMPPPYATRVCVRVCVRDREFRPSCLSMCWLDHMGWDHVMVKSRIS
jgi:hypothetical protein